MACSRDQPSACRPVSTTSQPARRFGRSLQVVLENASAIDEMVDSMPADEPAA